MSERKWPGATLKMPTVGGGRGGGAPRAAPGAKPKDAKRTLWRLVKLYARFGRPILWAILMTAASALIAVAIPYFSGRAFDFFDLRARTVDVPMLSRLLSLVAVLYAVNWLITTLSGVLLLKVSQKLVFSLRNAFFDKLQALPLAFYDTTAHGDTMSRMTNDVDNLSSTLAQMTTQLVSSVLTIVGSLCVMTALNLPLTLVVLLCVPLVTLLTRLVAGKSRAFFLAQQRNLGGLNSVIEESILGLKLVKAFGRQQDVLADFDAMNEQLYENSQRAQVWAGLMMPLMNVINNLTFALVALVGGALSVSGGLAIGTVVSFLSYSKHFGQPLNAIAGMFNTIQSALAGAERVFAVLDQPEQAPDRPDAVAHPHPQGHVRFEDVCFAYAPGRPVLRNITFDVPAGETVALVGETGSGKTTIVNLLTRFYDATSGRVLLDGIDIRDIRRDSLRACFSVVLQETCLFTGSILDNIRYARPGATDAEVIDAAKTARAHAFIEKLPDGYHTMVSGSADSLSQGQRQLLAIARAVLCDSPILILDEATSSVDTKTEKDIQRAMLTLMRGRTSFLIAHRLSTIRDADKILVIEHGCVRESGTHATLMAQKGAYYQMVIR
ncbi:MAG: ABC transporter ATP-binding protein [Clostridia bacterium]